MSTEHATLEDVINTESKDALIEWVYAKHGVKLAGSLRFDRLVAKARELEAAEAVGPVAAPAAPRDGTGRWLQNPKTGNKFPWTELLQARGDLVPCDPPPPPDPAEAEAP